MRPGMESDPSRSRVRLRAGIGLILMMILTDLGCSHLNSSGGPQYRRQGHAPLVNRFKRMGGHLRGHHDALGQPERHETWSTLDAPKVALGPVPQPQPQPEALPAPAPAPPVGSAPIPERANRPTVSLPGDSVAASPAPRVLDEPPTSARLVSDPAPTPETPTTPAPAPAPETNDLETIGQLIASGRARLEEFTTYQCVLTRQERVGHSLLPAEDVVLSVRRDPLAIRLEWTEGPNRGRQVFYSPVETEGMMVVRMASPLIPPLRLAPDSPMAMSNSRHPITSAGLGPIFDDIAERLEQARQEDASVGTFTFEGQETPEVVAFPCFKIVRRTPEGETWQLYLDSETYLPALLEGTAANGALLERHHFQDIRPDPPALADASAFSPVGAGGGRFGRRSPPPAEETRD
ncbi:hypothetical protein BH23PLA1_BH23PLA1_05860 [soil metagenome]